MESKSYIAVPPGATILELLRDRGMSREEFAKGMDMPEEDVVGLIDGDVVLAPLIAQKLEQVLGVPASFWEKLEAQYRENVILVEKENALEKEKDFS